MYYNSLINWVRPWTSLFGKKKNQNLPPLFGCKWHEIIITPNGYPNFTNSDYVITCKISKWVLCVDKNLACALNKIQNTSIWQGWYLQTRKFFSRNEVGLRKCFAFHSLYGQLCERDLHSNGSLNLITIENHIRTMYLETKEPTFSNSEFHVWFSRVLFT